MKLFRGIVNGLLLEGLVLSLLLGTIHLAKAQDSSPQVQALSARIMSELNNSLTCSAALIEAQARIKALEAKPAPQKEDK